MVPGALRAARAICCLLATLVTTLAPAAIYTVTNNVDGGPGSLRQAVIDANANPGVDQIILPSSVYILASPLPVITDSLFLVGSGVPTPVIHGADAHRVFFVGDGGATPMTLTLQGVVVMSGRAQGGAGGAGAGGGLGAGGAVFVNSNALLLLNDVRFENNTAVGGAGSVISGSRAGGGGGLGGAGGVGNIMGGGGGGFDAGAVGASAAVTNDPGSPGTFPGAAAGNGGNGAAGGTGGGGGGGGGSVVAGAHGGGGGVGGANGSPNDASSGSGGAGGDFGGGGGSANAGGAGGFGGGGGRGLNALSGAIVGGGAGGFGGGSGLGRSSDPLPVPGFGGGTAVGNTGGGGAGLGGAIFVRDGGSVEFAVVMEIGSSSAAGSGGTGATAYGSAMFMQGGSGTVRLRAAGAGFTIDIAGVIADERGATGNGALAARNVTVEGPGRVILRGANRYAGATGVTGTLEVAGSIISQTSVNAGGRIGGNGLIDNLLGIVGGVLDPALDADVANVLRLSGVLGLTPAAEYRTRLFADGNAAHARAGNTVTLNDPALTVQLAGTYAHALGNVFTILETTSGSITGTFAGLPEGSVLTLGGHAFLLAYAATRVTLSAITPPGPPTSVSSTAGLGQATISFSPPMSDGLSPVTGYTVDCGPGFVVTGSSPILVTGLATGATYTCNVTATNAIGTSSPATIAATTFALPGAPTIVSAAPGNQQAVVSFTAGADGGTPILDYTATCGAFSATGVSPLAVTGLTNGVAYSCTVRARNAAGLGPVSAAASVTPRTLPDAPTGVTATAGNGQATVGFTAPADNGSPITLYTATCGAQSATGAGSPIVVTGLANGTAVMCSVRASNVAGQGPPSANANVTPMGLPGAPAGVSVAPGNGQLTVDFTAAASNGSAITAYTATCGTQSATGTSSPLVVTGLANGIAVSCTVAATNGVGVGPASAPVSGTPSFKSFSGPSATGSGTITAVLTGGGAACNFAVARFIGIPPGASPIPPTAPPGGVSFAHGLFDFTLAGCTPGSTVTLAITYPGSVAGQTYWKYGPTPTDGAPHWYVMPATLGGNTATFSITDGGLGDDDLAANGTIVDQGGPGLAVPGTPIPTMSEWMLMLMGLLMLGFAGMMMRRR